MKTIIKITTALVLYFTFSYTQSDLQINFTDAKFNYLDSLDVKVAGEIILSKDEKKAYIASYGYGFYIVDISNPYDMKILSNYTGLSNWGVSISNDEKKAYLANIDSRLDIIDINNSSAPTLISHFDFNDSSMPRSVTVTQNEEIAYVPAGWTGGLKIVDINDTNSMKLIAHYDTQSADAQHITLSKDENTGYLSLNSGGLNILNLSTPSNPTLIKHIDISGYTYYSQLSPDENHIFVGSSNGLTILNIQNPQEPITLSTIEIPDSYERVKGLTLSEDMTKIYLAVSSGGILIVDITSLDEPKILEKYNSRQAESIKLSRNKTIAFIADNKDGLVSIDVSTPNFNKLVATYEFGNSLYTRKVLFSQDETKAYTISNSSSGGTNFLTVLDISDPKNISEITNFSGIDEPLDFTLFDNGQKIVVADSFGSDYFAEDDLDGIKILDISNLNNIQTIKTFNDTDGPIQGVIVSSDNKTLFTNERFKGIGIYDISDINSPILLSSTQDINNTSGYAWQNLKNYLTWVEKIKLSKDETKLFIADRYTALTILDISNLSAPSLYGSFYRENSTMSMEINDDETLAFLGTSNGLLTIYDISNLSQPQVLSTLENFDFSITDIKLSNNKNIIYLLESGKNMNFIDVSNPTKPKVVGNTQSLSSNYSVNVTNDGRFAYISNGYEGLSVLDITKNIYLTEEFDNHDLNFTLSNKLENNLTISIDLNDTSIINIDTSEKFLEADSYIDKNQSINILELGDKLGVSTLSFNINNSSSLLKESLYVHVTPKLDLSKYLLKGWNLISGDINLSNLSNDIQILWQYDSAQWSAYSNDETTKSEIKNYINVDEIETINSQNGTWVLANINQNIFLNDSNITQSTSFSKGWHLIGAKIDMDISILSCLDSSLVSIWKYYDNQWELNTNISNNNDLNSFEYIYQGEGFWINCN